jgi:hypothetical protein
MADLKPVTPIERQETGGLSRARIEFLYSPHLMNHGYFQFGNAVVSGGILNNENGRMRKKV